MVWMMAISLNIDENLGRDRRYITMIWQVQCTIVNELSIFRVLLPIIFRAPESEEQHLPPHSYT